MENLTFVLEMRDNVSRHLRDITEALEGVTDAAESVSGVSSEFSRVGHSAERAGGGLRSASESAGRYRDANERLRDANGRFIRDSSELNGELEEQDSMFSKLKGSVGAYAAAIGGALAGAAVAGFGKDVLQVGMDFDAGMSEVQALSGATGADLGRLREKAKQMGATTKFSATESAEAFKYMSLAGWDANEMLEGADGILAAAAASGEELALISDIVTNSYWSVA